MLALFAHVVAQKPGATLFYQPHGVAASMRIDALKNSICHGYDRLRLVNSLLIVLNIPNGLAFWSSAGRSLSGQF